jgi:integrase
MEARKRIELEEAGRAADARTAPRFCDFCAGEYKAHAMSQLKPSTWHGRQVFVLATLLEFFGDKRLDTFTLADIEAFKRWQLGKGMAPTTINARLLVLHRVLTYAQELDLPVSIPKWRSLKDRRQRAPKFWTEAQITLLFEKAAELVPEILPLIVCLANTGMRKAEAMNLTWADVDLDRRQFRVQAKPEGDWSPKSEKWRVVPINDAVLPYLAKPGKPADAVFPSARTGGRYSRWPDRLFDRARQAAGLVGGPHTLRHSYASHFLRHHPDLFLLARILGHSHTRVTELYSHLVPDALNAARDAVVFTLPVGEGPRETEPIWGPVIQLSEVA